jgi:hypothetical protein
MEEKINALLCLGYGVMHATSRGNCSKYLKGNWIVITIYKGSILRKPNITYFRNGRVFKNCTTLRVFFS